MDRYEIRDISLAPDGHRKIEWVRNNMPLLRGLEKEFSESRPFEGVKIALSVHLEAKTAYLCRVLAAGGARMSVTGSNVLSQKMKSLRLLAEDGMRVLPFTEHRRISTSIISAKLCLTVRISSSTTEAIW